MDLVLQGFSVSFILSIRGLTLDNTGGCTKAFER